MDGLKAELMYLMNDVNEFCQRLAAPDFLPSKQAVRTIRIAIRDSLHEPTHPVPNLVEPSVESRATACAFNTNYFQRNRNIRRWYSRIVIFMINTIKTHFYS